MEWTMLSDRIVSEYRLVQAISGHEGIYLMADRTGVWVFLKVLEAEVVDLEILDHLRDAAIPGMNGIRSYFIEAGRCYIIKNYVHGMDLYRYVETEGILSEEEVVVLLMDIHRVLSRLYDEYGYVFTDLHPKNIMVSEGSFVLVDTESICTLNSKDRKVKGVVGFMAPELYGFSQATMQSDLYSLGMIAKFALTGILPSIVHNEIELDRVQISREMRYLLQKATSFSPDHRFKNHEEFSLNLHRVKSRFVIRQRRYLEWVIILAIMAVIVLEFNLYETARAQELAPVQRDETEMKKIDLDLGSFMEYRVVENATGINFGYFDMMIETEASNGWMPLETTVVESGVGGLGEAEVTWCEDGERVYFHVTYQAGMPSDVVLYSTGDTRDLQTRLYDFSKSGDNAWTFSLDRRDLAVIREVSDTLAIRLYSEKNQCNDYICVSLPQVEG